jgi:hypothetical protein
MRSTRTFPLVTLVVAVAVPACLFGGDRENNGESVAAQFGNSVGSGGGGGGGDCTLTQGYWKNHEESWPVDSLVIGGETYDQAELLTLLQTSVSGDASLILAHQMIASMLNVLSGATADIGTVEALDAAEQWMLANKDADGRLPYGITDSAAHDEATAISDALANYNEGSVGPGHCDDGPPDGAGGSSSASSGDPGTGGSATTTSGSGGGSACVESCLISEDCQVGYGCLDGCCIDIPD